MVVNRSPAYAILPPFTVLNLRTAEELQGPTRTVRNPIPQGIPSFCGTRIPLPQVHPADRRTPALSPVSVVMHFVAWSCHRCEVLKEVGTSMRARFDFSRYESCILLCTGDAPISIGRLASHEGLGAVLAAHPSQGLIALKPWDAKSSQLTHH